MSKLIANLVLSGRWPSVRGKILAVVFVVFMMPSAELSAQIEYWRPGEIYGLYDIDEPSDMLSDYAQYTYWYRARNQSDAIRRFLLIRNELGIADSLPMSNQRREDFHALGDLYEMEWRDLYEEWKWYRPDLTELGKNDERPADALRLSSYRAPRLTCSANRRFGSRNDVWMCFLEIPVIWLASQIESDD